MGCLSRFGAVALLLGSLVFPVAVNPWTPLGFVVLAGALIVLTCQSGEGGEGSRRDRFESISVGAWLTAITSGFGIAISFALYNVAFILLTSFSPKFLTAEGTAGPTATAIARLPMWLFIFSVPFGGVLAGRLVGHERALVAIGCLGSAVALVLAIVTPHKVVWYVAAGLLGGLPTAPMWAGAGGRERDGKTRHLTYPALFLVFFASLLVCPPIVGAAVELTADPRIALLACAALLVLATLLFFMAKRSSARAVSC